jgi:hypothetical protein
MRRSSTALSGLARPGTPSRSSTESLRLDANAPGPEHVMPSPVAESPAREAAESIPEPTGPSKLSGPSITSQPPALEPPTTVPSSEPEQLQEVLSIPPVQPTPPPVPAPVEIPVASAEPESYVAESPQSLTRAESVRAADEALTVRRSEDSGSTRSHGQIVPPHERQLPTEILAAPWESGPLVAERSSQPEQEAPRAGPVDRVSTPPIVVEAPRQTNPLPFDQSSADKTSVANLVLKNRTRGSTVSSQVRPRTPSIPNGRVSRRPSISSLASSAAPFSSYPAQAASEPRQEGPAPPPVSNRCVRYYTNMRLRHNTIL